MHNYDFTLDRIISETEAAGLNGVSRDTFRRRTDRGEGPPKIRMSPWRIGYRLRDVLDDIKQREMAPNILSAG
jgi:predicted DNA-binding transcriptional regulator AlpA